MLSNVKLGVEDVDRRRAACSWQRNEISFDVTGMKFLYSMAAVRVMSSQHSAKFEKNNEIEK